MKYKFLIAVLIFIFGCNSEEKLEINLEKGNAVVEGKVINFENNSKVIRFAGETILRDIIQTAIIDSTGNFRVEIELINSQNVKFKYEERWSYLYLSPNDSLFLNIDADAFIKNSNPYYKISGSNPTTSENIRDFLKFHGPYSYEPKYGDSVSVEEYLKGLENQLSIEDSILNEFSKEYNTTDEFIHWAKKDNIYSVAGNSLLYFWYFDINYNEYKTEIFDTNLFPVDDDSAIVCDAYLHHLNNYLMANYYKSDTALSKLFNKKDIVGAYSRIFDRLVTNEKQGLSRDILLFSELFRLLDWNNMDYYKSLLSSYGEYIENQELLNILLEKKTTSKIQETEQRTTLNLQLNSKSEIVKNFWKTISKKHKGKIIYVDIWATWCGPCHTEIPYAIDLHNYFEGKQIAFVNLCLASNKDDWEKMLKKNHIKGDNYYFNSDETELLRDELNFHGYPTYMIIDKGGILIDKDAPRPSSSKKIKEKLNRLLKN